MACLNDFPRITVGDATVFHGSNLDVLPFMADNSVDSVVCDPPYELGFMGKKWDSSGIAYSVELWQECLRVLKPGGHLLAFGGSRTWHRLAVAIEDAGFEMRDSIAWLYGSGFPKSHDISKGIDKRNGQGATVTKQIGEALLEAREKRGISKTQADQMFCDGSTNWTWFEGRPAGQRPPTSETFSRIVSQWKELEPLSELIAEAQREVIGQKEGNLLAVAPGQDNDRSAVNMDVTAPSTEEAKKWAGWGTALKPAFEPVVVARKPLIGTVAENVLAWGVGGLNIDASRIGRAENDVSVAGARTATFGTQKTVSGGDGSGGWEQNSSGRWPANIILDEYTASLLPESGPTGSGKVSGFRKGGGDGVSVGLAGKKNAADGFSDSGSVSRFFYVAKASKRDRNEGLDELQTKQTVGGGGLGNPVSGAYGSEKAAAKNFHPTVKPTDLMRYLIKLVTPAGGIVLDPFTGSGSTGKAALLGGYRFIGIELTEDYLPIIEGRLRWADQECNNQNVAAEAEKAETLF